jgi:hypothetical protein
MFQIDRRGRFKNVSSLNSHLRLTLGPHTSFVRTQQAHNENGWRFVMLGNDVVVGNLIWVNDTGARMAESAIASS